MLYWKIKKINRKYKKTQWKDKENQKYTGEEIWRRSEECNKGWTYWNDS